MKLELRKDFAYSLVVPTSMGVRITPVNGQPVHCSNTFMMQATSAETNMASISSYLGLSVKVLTTFVKDSPIICHHLTPLYIVVYFRRTGPKSAAQFQLKYRIHLKGGDF